MVVLQKVFAPLPPSLSIPAPCHQDWCEQEKTLADVVVVVVVDDDDIGAKIREKEISRRERFAKRERAGGKSGK